MPKRTTSIGPQQLDCSDGAKMLIEQMKEHPEDFRGYGAKFTSILDKARTATQGGVTAMSKRDVIAIMDAAETHLYEVWLAEDVITQLMTPRAQAGERDATTARQICTDRAGPERRSAQDSRRAVSPSQYGRRLQIGTTRRGSSPRPEQRQPTRHAPLQHKRQVQLLMKIVVYSRLISF
jgi:hypothetical protein